MNTTQNGGNRARTRDAASAPKHQDSKEVAKTAAAGAPDYLREQMKADAGAGVSDAKGDSLVPMIVVLQGQTPQAQRGKPEYIEGAAAGDIWLRNAQKPIIKAVSVGDPGLMVQPCYFYKNIGEWIPREPDGSGGGFVASHEWFDGWETSDWAKSRGIHQVEDPETGAKKWMGEGDAHEFIEARNHVVIVYQEGYTPVPYLIPMSGSQHQVSRTWTFMMKNKVTDGARDPSWAHKYILKTRLASKGKLSWYVFDVLEGGPDGTTAWVSAEEYKAGKTLHEAFRSGEKQADMSGSTETAAGAGTTAQDKKAAEAI